MIEAEKLKERFARDQGNGVGSVVLELDLFEKHRAAFRQSID
jgi:hypothetical protein